MAIDRLSPHCGSSLKPNTTQPYYTSPQQPLVHSALEDLLRNFNFNLPPNRIVTMLQAGIQLPAPEQADVLRVKGFISLNQWEGGVSFFHSQPEFKNGRKPRNGAQCVHLCKLQPRVFLIFTAVLHMSLQSVAQQLSCQFSQVLINIRA